MNELIVNGMLIDWLIRAGKFTDEIWRHLTSAEGAADVELPDQLVGLLEEALDTNSLGAVAPDDALKNNSEDTASWRRRVLLTRVNAVWGQLDAIYTSHAVTVQDGLPAHWADLTERELHQELRRTAFTLLGTIEVFWELLSA